MARFGDGGGLCYHHYGRFHEVMAEASYQSIVKPFVEHVLPLATGLRQRLEAGIDVIDIGCGGGRALLMLAEQFPRSRFTGIDLCDDAFAEALQVAATKGLGNLRFRQQDLAAAERLEDADLILASDAIHDQKHPQATLDLVRRSPPRRRFPDGRVRRLEPAREQSRPPDRHLSLHMSVMHCMPVSLGQGGEALGTMMGVELASQMLEKAGFASVEVSRLQHDPFNAYFIATA